MLGVAICGNGGLRGGGLIHGWGGVHQRTGSEGYVTAIGAKGLGTLQNKRAVAPGRPCAFCCEEKGGKALSGVCWCSMGAGAVFTAACGLLERHGAAMLLKCGRQLRSRVGMVQRVWCTPVHWGQASGRQARGAGAHPPDALLSWWVG